MKFKTRLQVTFFSIILLPLILMMMVFMAIVVYLTNVRQGIGIQEMDYGMLADNMTVRKPGSV